MPQSELWPNVFNDQAFFQSSMGLVRSALAGLCSFPLASSETMGLWEAANREKVPPNSSPCVHTIKLRDIGIA